MTAWKAKYEEAAERIEELEAEFGNVNAIEARCSSIPVEWLEIGGVRIGIDTGGAAVRVELPKTLYGWNAE